MTDKSQNWKATKQDEDERLDLFLTDKLNTSRNQVQNKIEAGQVEVNKNRAEKSGIMLSEGDEITLHSRNQKTDKQAKQEREQLEVEVIEESNNFLVVNKPSGLLVHPTAKKEKITLVHWLLDHYPDIKTVGDFDDRPGIVHRLDKDTSGLLVVARNQEMFKHLKQQFKQRKIEKRYTTLVHGNIDSDTGTIKLPIARGKNGKMVAKPADSDKGKRAITKFKVKKRFSGYTLLDVQIITGRTHQIKVHFYARNNPLVGEDYYIQNNQINNLDEELGRAFLNARKLCFYDLDNGKICAESELPQELKRVLEDLN
ncbi:MAG: RluA family pseudouridine synthase [Parcubacteria group bacterium QH_9_35_7]|nr:MAG: RluA family pseudouridine synthase [Parcubacteria group bacterium QH_9_35_7]